MTSAALVEQTAAPLLEMRGISKRFHGVQALQDVSLTVRAGQVLALVGENGAGKSTLIKVLSGAAVADEGEVWCEGQQVDVDTPEAAAALGIATVYQEFSLISSLSVAENLFLNHLPKRGPLVDWGLLRRMTVEQLGSLGLDFSPDRLVGSMTVAEKQMLEIAKATRQNARVLILDEPTAVLGGKDVDRLLSLVKSLRAKGIGVVFISHRLDEIFDLADTFVVLKDGRVAGSGLVRDTGHEQLVSMMVGRDFAFAASARAASSSGREVVRVQGLTRAGAFEDVSFALHAGEVVGMAGLRGAGRSQVSRAIFGADRVDSGEIYVDGKLTTIRGPRHAVDLGMGFLPEDRKSSGLHFNMSTAQNITLVNTALGRRRWLSPKGERASAERYRTELSIRVPDVSLPVLNLSGGNQQKVVLAKWLDAGVSTLLLNEPTRGVDVGAKSEIYDLIDGLCAAGLAVLLVSSELPEILRLSDRILVMRSGRLVSQMARAEATEEKVAAYMVSGVTR